MASPKNTDLLSTVDEIVASDLKIVRGLNKKREIGRLVFEVMKRDGLNREGFLETIAKDRFDFHMVKKMLLALRYPGAHRAKAFVEGNVYIPDRVLPPQERAYRFSGRFTPARIHIEASQIDSRVVKAVLDRFPDVERSVIGRLKDVREKGPSFAATLGKNELFLVAEKFDIFKACPCTRGVFGCGYTILNIGFGCAYDCTYCYLQHYTNAPGIILPVNVEEILERLAVILGKAKRPLRVGTGEFTDSLVFEEVVPYSRYLVPFFAGGDHILELKTKSVNIENLLEMEGGPNVVIAWSLNTPSRISADEPDTPTLQQRLEAAARILDRGYGVGFHFDPIIRYDGWEREYRETVEMMFEVTGGRIEWISLGTLRFHRSLKPVIERRFPDPSLLDGELLIDSLDGKMRYIEPVRVDIFRKMTNRIKGHGGDAVVYLCMEPERVWRQVFGRPAAAPHRCRGIDLP
ncbi:radical SAM protein [Thermodesulfobacteriota bacterium]